MGSIPFHHILANSLSYHSITRGHCALSSFLIHTFNATHKYPAFAKSASEYFSSEANHFLSFNTTSYASNTLFNFVLHSSSFLASNLDSPYATQRAGSVAVGAFVAESGPASAQLLGSTPAERAKIMEYNLHGEHEVSTATLPALLVAYGLSKFDAKREFEAFGEFKGEVVEFGGN